jgi:hypothetical protein
MLFFSLDLLPLTHFRPLTHHIRARREHFPFPRSFLLARLKRRHLVLDLLWSNNSDELARSIHRSEGPLHRRLFGIWNSALETAERIAEGRKISKGIRDQSSQSQHRTPSVASGAGYCFATSNK